MDVVAAVVGGEVAQDGGIEDYGFYLSGEKLVERLLDARDFQHIGPQIAESRGSRATCGCGDQSAAQVLWPRDVAHHLLHRERCRGLAV